MRNIFSRKGFSFDVSYTTREKRPGEIEGIDYQFIPKEQFEEMIQNNEFYEWVEYNGNYYGTGLEEWKTRDIFIMEPNGVGHINENDRSDCVVIFIDPPQDVRINRMEVTRGWDQMTIAERLIFDEKRFKDFSDYDIIISENKF